MRSKAVDISQRGNLTMREAMIYAGVGYVRAKKLLVEGEWKAFRLGNEIRVLKSSLDEWQLEESKKFVRAGL